MSDLSVLSKRERQVFDLLAVGVKNAEVARRLSLSTTTVATFRFRILRKLEVTTNAQLARLHAIAALAIAADHALVAATLCAHVARWEPFEARDTGEICVGGFRYATHLDAAGVPELHDMMRRALSAALERSKQVRAA